MSSTQHDDFPADDEYRSLSVAAVLALVLGLLSPAVLVWQLLVVLPCLAVVLAVVALRGIARSGAAGRGLALIGMAVALLSLGAWGGYRTAYRQRVHAQAAPTADLMLELLSEGNTQDAFLLTLGDKERGVLAAHFAGDHSAEQTDDGQFHDGHSHDGPNSPEQQLEQFLDMAGVEALVASAPFEGWTIVSRGPVVPRPGGRLAIAQTYEVRPAAGPARRYAVGLEGPSNAAAPPVWRVIGVTQADANAL